MNEKLAVLLSVIGPRERTGWLIDQVKQSFAQGVSMNVKEAAADTAFNSVEPAALTSRERRKREKYETTRPYSESEKLELVRQALDTIFLDLPAMQTAGMEQLRKLGAHADKIEFLAPDEPAEEQGEADLQYAKELVGV